MKRKKLNVKHLWIQFEDFLFPRLRLSITDRDVYSHLIRRSKAGHVICVRLPDEIRGLRPGLPAVAGAIAVGGPASSPQSPHLEDLDFLKTRALRQSIHLRERGHCFYCLRRTDARVQCLDHVVPRARAGRNSYRNLVSSCLECNSLKGERPAAHFLRWLYRERRITSAELNARLRALDALASGKLPPPVLHPDTPIGCKGRPPGSSYVSGS